MRIRAEMADDVGPRIPRQLQVLLKAQGEARLIDVCVCSAIGVGCERPPLRNTKGGLRQRVIRSAGARYCPFPTAPPTQGDDLWRTIELLNAVVKARVALVQRQESPRVKMRPALT